MNPEVNHEGPHIEHEVTCAKCRARYCDICNSSCPQCNSPHITGPKDRYFCGWKI